MEEDGNPDVVRELYERAIANIPLKMVSYVGDISDNIKSAFVNVL